MADETRARGGIADFARISGLSHSTINRYVKAGKAPAGVFIGERRKWFLDEIEAWVREQATRPRRGAANLQAGETTP